MHPMFVKLFIEPDADDLLACEEEQDRKRRRALRSGHSQARRATMTTAPTTGWGRRGR
jgi:hypothetical protein